MIPSTASSPVPREVEDVVRQWDQSERETDITITPLPFLSPSLPLPINQKLFVATNVLHTLPGKY